MMNIISNDMKILKMIMNVIEVILYIIHTLLVKHKINGKTIQFCCDIIYHLVMMDIAIIENIYTIREWHSYLNKLIVATIFKI